MSIIVKEDPLQGRECRLVCPWVDGSNIIPIQVYLCRPCLDVGNVQISRDLPPMAVKFCAKIVAAEVLPLAA